MNGNTSPGNGVRPHLLPIAQRERWQPLRSGFVNIYKYDQEEFHYENGRLLLRGNNGTGKSRVLALQLPFLLDGEVIPQRLEPDADPAKRVEWNLLMGRYPDRTGYTWIEFGRRGEGEDHYMTLGCGLGAVEGQTGVRKWFFMTSQRIGLELELAGEGNHVLGKDRLRERIGSAGEVFDSVGPYRQAVNRALFKLDEFRYASLVNLLIQLRRPQLTRRLDEDDLSRALIEALQPVSSAIISDVAEAFRNLESDRNALESFLSASSGVERFLNRYRRYAETAARRRADRLRAAHSVYETRMREIRTVETEREALRTKLEVLRREMERLSSVQNTVTAEITTLQESPQMKDAHALERVQREAAEKRKDAGVAAAELQRATEARNSRIAECSIARTAWDQHKALLAGSMDAASRAAALAGLENAHREWIGSIDLAHLPEEAGLRLIQNRIAAGIGKQAERTAHIRKLNERIASAEIELERSTQARNQFAGLVDEARETVNATHQEHVSATTFFIEAIERWAENLVELQFQFGESFAAGILEWSANPQNASPFASALLRSVNEAAARYAAVRAHWKQLETAQRAELDALLDERRQLESGHHTPPPPPYTRAAGARAAQPGAPLWLLCDFAPGLDRAEQAGFEAALESAGLLDAWVTPTGQLLDPKNHDAVLVIATGPVPAEDTHLGNILVPAPHPLDQEPAVPEEIVRSVLRQIGKERGAGNVWAAADGRWQNGPLHGAWNKPAAEHIGQAARELARLERLGAVESAIAEANAKLASVAAALETIEQQEATAGHEATSAPADDPVRAASNKLSTATDYLDNLRRRLAEAEAQVSLKRTECVEAKDHRNRAAQDLGIAEWMDRLAELDAGISEYRIALSALWPTMQAFLDARAGFQRAELLVEESEERVNRQTEIADRQERLASAAAVEHETLRQTVGAGVDEILKRLAFARGGLAEIEQQARNAGGQHRKMELDIAAIDERLRNLAEMLQGETTRRDDSARVLQAFAGTGLLHLAVPGMADHDAPAWSITRTVEVAREVASKLESVESDNGAWERHQKTVQSDFNELMQTLSAQGCQPSAIFRDDVFVATALFAGRDCTMEDLHQILSSEVTTRQMLLDAREREILENHLVGEVSSHLHDLLNAGEEQIQEMNRELESRPMSTGMRLRFVWGLAEDGPPGLADVRKRLMRSHATWSSAERQALGSFLQQQIQAVRSQTDTGNWQDSLAEALDYRKWHRFGVERYQDGVWKRLTRRTHGTGSGGEKAVALTLPHFAAAAAFYRTADRCAPRLILLDEAFVGIDADMRAKCMGLIHTFDLDFIMTSEREWGCYATLPGVAIYQLSTRPGIDAIGLTRWVWNGRQKILETHPADLVTAAASSLVP